MTIQDNMELLEAALKHSIGWSMRIRRKINQQQVDNMIDTEKQKLKLKRQQLAELPAVELMNTKLRDDAHVRAFITHFKIELNHLMGVKWLKRSHLDELHDQLGSLSELDSLECFGDSQKRNQDEQDVDRAHNSWPGKPRIKIKGKYSGVYNLNGQSDDDDDDDGDGGDGRKPKTKRQPTSKMRQNADEVDDGYRSLSRNGSPRASLLQQLNDIKSRIVDLVCELDSNPITSQLNEDDLNAYRRRRDTLVSKLDSLIESQMEEPSTTGNLSKGLHSSSSSSSTSSSLISTSSTSTSSSLSQINKPKRRQQSSSSSSLMIKDDNYKSHVHSDGYEEQVQVIDYNTKRKQRSQLDEQTEADTLASMTQPLVVNSSMTRVDVSQSQAAISSSKHPIDFGAMMRSYDEKQQQKQSVNNQTNNNKDNNSNHTPTSSSTSTYSSSSQASTSSFI